MHCCLRNCLLIVRITISILASFGDRLAKQKVNTPEGPELLFFYAFKPSRMGSVLREKTQVGPVEKASSPLLLLLNIPDNGAYYLSPATEISAETVGSFIEAFKAGALERKQLR